MRAEPNQSVPRVSHAAPHQNDGRLLLPRRTRRVMVRTAVGLVSLVFLLVVLGVVMVGWSPSWWRPIEAGDPGLAAAGAELENEIAGELSRVRAGAGGSAPGGGAWRSDEWTVEIGAEEATAWMNTRLRKWLANQDLELPEQVGEIQVDFSDGSITLGAAVAVGDSRRVVSARSRPRVGKDGALWLSATTVYAGRLRLPLKLVTDDHGPDWLARELRDAPGFHETLRVLRGEAPAVRDPVVTLGDGRRVRIVGVRLREGVAAVTCRTEAGL